MDSVALDSSALEQSSSKTGLLEKPAAESKPSQAGLKHSKLVGSKLHQATLGSKVSNESKGSDGLESSESYQVQLEASVPLPGLVQIQPHVKTLAQSPSLSNELAKAQSQGLIPAFTQVQPIYKE